MTATGTEANEEEATYRLTPKGACCAAVIKLGYDGELGEAVWSYLEAFCLKRLQQDEPDAEYAALVFDGDGGTIIGVKKGE